MSQLTLLDGPLGTVLGERGFDLSEPGWSANVLRQAPDAITAIHRDYAEAGATVHTANTFRTRERNVGSDWRSLTSLAVDLVRAAVANDHHIAASIAPLADCYQPLLSPRNCRDEHRAFIEYLGSLSLDLFLIETFPSPSEALVAVEECVRTNTPTWLALTAGPAATLMTPPMMHETARRAVDAGVQAILVNCVDARQTLPYVHALSNLGVPFGAYANAGPAEAGLGWGADERGHQEYVKLAQSWVECGAQIIGSCCGTGPTHIAALKRSFATE